MALLRRHADDIARLSGQGRAVIEFGSGSSTKTPLLLAAVRPPVYIPVDISDEFLAEAAQATAAAHPAIRVVPVAGDFTLPLFLGSLAGEAPRLGFFPGSTIGNFGPAAAVDLLRSFAATLGSDARLVIGIDLRKDPRLIEAAYDDAAGVTAEFNLNLIHRLNRELGASIDLDAFEHRAVWHDGHGRVEMHLAAVRDIEFTIAGRRFAMNAGETIHTENSYKYRIEEAQLLGRAAGWEPMAVWIDPDRLFSLHVWKSTPEAIEP
jgi:dimethylhistidine N-methyltransferase